MTTEEEKLKDAVLRGQQAEALINHPLHQQARIMIEAELVRANRETKYDQHELRAEIWRKQQIVDWYEKTYARAVRDGKLAERKLEQLAKAAKGALRRVI